MWLNNEIAEKDLEQVSSAEFIPWERLRNRTILVTGATGLIGYTLVSALLYADKKKSLNLHVIALVRDEDKAKRRFCGLEECIGALRFCVGTVEHLPMIEGAIDYIVHAASQTASAEFIHHPVETIRTAVNGTENLLELARIKESRGFVYLSSMEVYGHPVKGHKVKESEIGALPPLDLRNSYPLSKQICENLCCAYAAEYDLPATIIRLTQTFGAGVHYQDKRIFAYFARCVMEKKDIVLKTKGETERSYLYSTDASTAILTVLLKGKPRQAYNAADENTYCSIAEMARKVAGKGNIQVKFDLQDETKLGYPKPLYMDLDTSLLRELGWGPCGGELLNMYERMIECMCDIIH